MDIPVSTMTTEDARSLRAGHDAYVRHLGRLSRGSLQALELKELHNAGYRRLMGGPQSKDELISAIVGYRYPIEQLNESIHVLYHDTHNWPACEWCHPHMSYDCECRLGRQQ